VGVISKGDVPRTLVRAVVTFVPAYVAAAARFHTRNQ
jgi:hypothetical protein